MKRDFRVINIFTLLNGWRMLRRLMRKAFWSRTINQLRWDDVAAILLDYSKIIRKTFWLVSCSTGSFESACLMLVINQTKYSSKQHSVWHSKYHHFSRRFEISLLALNAILFPFLTSCNKKKIENASKSRNSRFKCKLELIHVAGGLMNVESALKLINFKNCKTNSTELKFVCRTYSKVSEKRKNEVGCGWNDETLSWSWL